MASWRIFSSSGWSLLFTSRRPMGIRYKNSSKHRNSCFRWTSGERGNKISKQIGYTLYTKLYTAVYPQAIVDFLLYNIFMDKFSKEEIELLVFHEVIIPIKKTNQPQHWRFPEYSNNDIKGFKRVLKSINNMLLSNQIEREWRPILTRKLSTSETDFSSDFLVIIGKARNR